MKNTETFVIAKNKKTIAKNLLRWFYSSMEPYPWRKDWKKFHNPYHVWVSEIMLQQTVIKAVLPKYSAFIKTLPNVAQLAQADENQLRQLVSGLGYYRRFNSLHKAAQIVTKDGWPKSYTDWLALPGVGPYTASAVCSITQNLAVAAVDGNVERVIARVFGIFDPIDILATKKKITEISNQLIDSKKPGDYNQAVMELGQKICRPSSPTCADCPIQSHCFAYKKGAQAETPIKSKKTVLMEQTINIYLAKSSHEKWLIIKRPDAAKFLKNHHGFLTGLSDHKKSVFDGFQAKNLLSHSNKIGQFTHAITNHKILAHVFLVKSAHLPSGIKKEATWLPLEDIMPSLISSLDKKAWQLKLKNDHL